MNTKIGYPDVFVPGRIPTVTYVDRQLASIDKVIQNVANNAKLLIIGGKSKSGKTVLVNRFHPQDNAVWISGGNISEVDYFWEFINEKINGYTHTEVAQTKDKSKDLSLNGSIEAQITPVIKATGSAGIGGARGASTTISQSRDSSSKVTAIQGLMKMKKTLVIDDFQYIKDMVAREILLSLKDILSQGLPVIIITSNPSKTLSLLEMDMEGRFLFKVIPPWSREDLWKIAEKGFKALQISYTDDKLNQLANAAFGCPHLMQDFCYELCNQELIHNHGAIPAAVEISRFLTQIAHENGALADNRFKIKTSGSRKQWELTDGTRADLYTIVKKALKKIRPDMNVIPYSMLENAIREIVACEEKPRKNDVSRVLSNLERVSRENKSTEPWLIWDNEKSELEITEPYFLLWLNMT